MDFSKKKLLVISITVIMMILFSKIFGYTLNTFTPKNGASSETINFRKAANLNSNSIVKTIPKNTTFKVLGDIDNFYIVLLKNNEIGLTSKDYTTIVDDSNSDSYEQIEHFFGTITENSVNLRGGPGTNFKIYKKLKKGDKIEVIGKIDNWYIVVTSDNYIGMIRQDLILTNSDNNNASSNLPNTAETVLSLINNARAENGLAPLSTLELLDSTAKVKAKDMVTNDYFSHNSPTYGSPFNMMKNAGITFKTAGENIAGNSSVEKAVNSWLLSDTHKENILSNAYNFVGIGVEKSDTYGYVIVVMFIGK